MRVSREQAAENRQRIVTTAARLFREKGFDGIGVADLMRQAGLTHGGFYGQFGSKEDLMAEASDMVLRQSLQRWHERIARHPEDPLGAVVHAYLRPQHRDEPGGGCAFAAMGSELARQPKSLRRPITETLRGFFDMLGNLIGGRGAAAKRKQGMYAYSAMVGAIVLSRIADDDELSREILAAVAEGITARQ